jgi:c-di-GMP-binding flagellar brake protein YcgR
MDLVSRVKELIDNYKFKSFKKVINGKELVITFDFDENNKYKLIIQNEKHLSLECLNKNLKL